MKPAVRPPRSSTPTRGRRPREEAHETLHGLSACLAVFRKRPDDLVRIAYTESARRPIAELLREAAKRRIPYNEVSPEELARIADAEHHEGLALVVRKRRELSLEELARAAQAKKGLLVALDRIGNPHNLGAILRSASYFGAAGIVFPKAPGQAGLTPSAVRIAEGGAEQVPVVAVPDLAEALRFLRSERFSILAADTRGGASAFTVRWPDCSVLVLGNEREGLASEIRALCEHRLSIPGTGETESLNVSVAAGILLAEWARSTAPVTKPPPRR